jgi:hypothetical protein
MSEGFRNDIALRPHLQLIVSDHARCLQTLVHITLFRTSWL